MVTQARKSWESINYIPRRSQRDLFCRLNSQSVWPMKLETTALSTHRYMSLNHDLETLSPLVARLQVTAGRSSTQRRLSSDATWWSCMATNGKRSSRGSPRTSFGTCILLSSMSRFVHLTHLCNKPDLTTDAVQVLHVTLLSCTEMVPGMQVFC